MQPLGPQAVGDKPFSSILISHHCPVVLSVVYRPEGRTSSPRSIYLYTLKTPAGKMSKATQTIRNVLSPRVSIGPRVP